MAYNSSRGGYSSVDNGEDQPRDELGEIQLKMNQTTDESLESTRRMLSMAEESQDAGVKTIVSLNAQGEQLDRIEEGMDKINTDMKDAEKSLEGLEKCCGLCVLPWKKTKKGQGTNYDATWKNDGSSGQPNSEGPRPMVGGTMAPTGPMVARITDDAREDEMDENLTQVGSMVSNLRNMAIDMGNEIDSQNRAIDRVNQKGSSNETRVVEANKRANKLLKS